MCPKCGDKVELKTIFEPPMKDKLASTKIIRKDIKPSGTGSFVVEATEMIVPWPDQVEDGNWCGGAKANFSGLGDDWKKKWDGQSFHFKVSCAGKYGKSKDIALERFPNAKTSPHAGESTFRPGKKETIDFTIGGIVRRELVANSWARSSYKFKWKFDVELKDDTIVLTTKFKWNFIFDRNKLDDEDKELEPVKFYYTHANQNGKTKLFMNFVKEFRKSVLGHWNTELTRYHLHRKKCVRGKKCTCVYGCCKFRVRLEISAGDYHTVDVVLGKGRAHSGRLFTRESRPGMSWRHEMGHWLSLPDEYADGGHDVGPDAASFSWDDKDALMGYNLQVKPFYLTYILGKWIKDATGEEFEVIEIK